MARIPLQYAGLTSLAAAPVLRLHAGHVYANGYLLADVIALLPSGLRSEGLLSLLPAEARARLGDRSWLAAGARASTIAVRLLAAEPEWAPWRRADAFERECARIRAELATPPPVAGDVAAAVLLDAIGDTQRRLGEYLRIVSWGMVFAYVFYHLLGELVRRFAPALLEEGAALTVGLPGVCSYEAARELAHLRDLVDRTPGLSATITTQGPHAAWVIIAADRGPLGEGFRTFLARHGHRMTGRDLRRPTWREVPELLVTLIATEPATPGRGTASSSRSAEHRRLEATRAIARALGGALGPARRAAFHATLAGAQRYVVVRENMRYYSDYFMARLRQLALALGDRLVSAGRLTDPDEVFFLTLEELRRAAATAEPLGALAAERRSALERDAATPPPAVLDGDAPPIARPGATAAAAAANDELHGETGAPGRRRAPARLLHGPLDFDRVRAGDVIVAAYTDPSWMAVLERAGGLVLEAGGQLSHGAIVARELGIPALVNVAGATRAIRDGDLVELDASAGTVAIVGRS